MLATQHGRTMQPLMGGVVLTRNRQADATISTVAAALAGFADGAIVVTGGAVNLVSDLRAPGGCKGELAPIELLSVRQKQIGG